MLCTDLQFGQLETLTYIDRQLKKVSALIVCLLITKLLSSKFIELDVCRRPLSTNPVTFIKGTETSWSSARSCKPQLSN